MATSKRTRIFMGFLAGLFLLTSSALTIAVILQSSQDSSTQSSDTQDSTQQSTTPKDALQGTKLTDYKSGTPVPKLKVEDIKKGTGATVKAGATITADYTGAVAKTGVIFQSSKDSGQPASFSLKQVIAGWSQGVPGMKVGGTRRLFIPASLAYGKNPPPGSGIPANADLVFDVTVRKIDK
jgi:FKBP-type peptidyl-prolyl cis-trans isomerase